MGRRHEHTERGPVVGLQGGLGSLDPFRFREHVAKAPKSHWIQERPRSFDDVTPEGQVLVGEFGLLPGLGQDGQGVSASRRPVVVRRLCRPGLLGPNEGMGHQPPPPVGNRHQGHPQGREVHANRHPLPAVDANRLIHPTALQPDESLGPSRRRSQGQGIDPEAVGVEQREGGRHDQGGRRAQSGGQRNRPMDRAGDPSLQGHAVLQKSPGRSSEVVGPVALGAPPHAAIQGEGGVLEIRKRATEMDLRTVQRDTCDLHRPVDRHGEHGQVVVVGMLSNQVHATRGDDPEGLAQSAKPILGNSRNSHAPAAAATAAENPAITICP